VETAPITFERRLSCGSDEAFAAYTSRIGDRFVAVAEAR
jgi:hypothetical protein